MDATTDNTVRSFWVNPDPKYHNPRVFDDLAEAKKSIVPEIGAFEGWKACRAGVIVRVAIPAEAKRLSGPGRQCRAAYVDVLAVVGADVGHSIFGGKIYRVGERVFAHRWNYDVHPTCSDAGIHFFLTRIEAEQVARTTPAIPA